MNHRRGSTPIYKGSGDSLKGIDPSMKHHRGCALMWIYAKLCRRMETSGRLWGPMGVYGAQ